MTQFLNNHGDINLYNFVSIGATYMVYTDQNLIGSEENIAVNSHPFWAHMAVYRPKVRDLNVPPDSTDGSITKEHLEEVSRLNTRFDTDCYRFKDCVDLFNEQASSCAAGYTRVGYDRSQCDSPLPFVRHASIQVTIHGVSLKSRRDTMASQSVASLAMHPMHAPGEEAVVTVTVSATLER